MATLLKEEAPWERTPLLSRVRLLKLNAQGEAVFGKIRVQLSPELGILYKQEEA